MDYALYLRYSKQMKNKGIFLDRDGTIIVDKHYLKDPNDIEYFEDTFEVLKKLQDLGFLLFIVTNQSGIGRGYFTEEQMHKVHNKILSDFKNHNIEIKEVVFCPHAPEDNCLCRKPLPKLINELCDKYSIYKSKSYMVGDKIIDAKCGQNACMNGAMVNPQNPPEGFPSFKDLTSFYNYLRHLFTKASK